MSFTCAAPLARAVIVIVSICVCAPRIAPPMSASAVPTVPRSLPFVAVAASFRAGTYADALSGVQILQNRADLSPADRVYLGRQAAICRAKLTPGPTSPIPLMPVPTAGASDCGPRALLFVCRENSVPANLSALTAAAGTKPGTGTSMAGLADAARRAGFAPVGVQVDADALKRIHPPAIAWVGGDHYVAVTTINGGFGQDLATVHDPATGGKSDITEADLLGESGGVLLLLPRETLSSDRKENP